MQSIHRYGLSLGIVALAGVASAVAAPELPAEMAVHWDAAGDADGYVPRWAGQALLPALSLLVLGVFALAPRLDPLGENVAAVRAAYDWLAVGTVALLAYLHALVLLVNAGADIDLLQAMVPAVAALYVVVGLVLDRVEQNWVLGVRTPWTLDDETVWNRTHDRAGTLFVLAGIVSLGGLLVPEYATAFVVAPVAVAALASAAYSYVLYRHRPA